MVYRGIFQKRLANRISRGVVLGARKEGKVGTAFARYGDSPERNGVPAKNFAVVAIPGIAKPLDFVPADYEKRLVKNDFAWEAKNRDKILAEWTKRYDSKSLPK